MSFGKPDPYKVSESRKKLGRNCWICSIEIQFAAFCKVLTDSLHAAVLIVKLTVHLADDNITAFYANQKFITMLTKACQ
jgi:hypothetical protein